MWAVRVRGRHFNGRQPSGLISIFRLQDESSFGELGGGVGAYVRDKNTSASLCPKNAGMGFCTRKGGGGVFVGRYGTTSSHHRRYLVIVQHNTLLATVHS